MLEAFFRVLGGRHFGLRPAEAEAEVHDLHYVRLVVYYQYFHNTPEREGPPPAQGHHSAGKQTGRSLRRNRAFHASSK